MMKVIRPQNNWLQALLLTLCGLFILSGALNRGFSEYFFAIPFLLYFILLSSTSGILTKVLSSTFLLFCIGAYQASASGKNTLIYPYVGKEVKIESEWIAIESESREYLALLWPSKENTSITVPNSSILKISQQESCRIIKVVVGHPDLSESRKAILKCGTRSVVISEKTINDHLGQEITLEEKGLQSVILQRPWVIALTALMAWPVLFIALI